MKSIDEAEAQRRFDEILDEAQRQTIVITSQGRDMAVMMSITAYERLHQGNVEAFLHARGNAAAEAAQHGLSEAELGRLLRDDA